jgi:tetratricopeptide (TPR) repeat protein
VIDNQLCQMGLFKELRDRLETRRALGVEMNATEYRWLGSTYQGSEALEILDNGAKKFPDSVELHSDYMQLLAKAGKKEAAWKAYERGRDLYFAKVERCEAPAMPIDSHGIELPPPPPTLVALPWYTYLVQEGKEDELHRLEDRLRGLCAKSRTEAKELLLPRAFAEFSAGRYAAAATSLEMCLREKLWNESASEALITGALARSFRAIDRRQEAIGWYQRAVQISGVDPGLLSEFLCLVVQEHRVDGLLKELPAFEQTWLRLNVRVNAILTCFSAWAALAAGDERAASEKLVLAGPYNLLASHQPTLGADEGLICAVILETVSRNSAEQQRAGESTEFLKRFPPTPPTR